MDLFIVGDVHGCFHTFQKLLSYWNPAAEQLIQVGDLISKGKFCPQVVELARLLAIKHGAIFLKRNHEQQFIDHYIQGYESQFWWNHFIQPVAKQYDYYDRELEVDVRWFNQLPLYWTNDAIFVSHAGVSMTGDPFDLANPSNVLYNRSPLKNIGKLQVIGHTPTNGTPLYEPQNNYCNIDTGAFKGQALTAVRLSADGSLNEFVSEWTIIEDIL